MSVCIPNSSHSRCGSADLEVFSLHSSDEDCFETAACAATVAKPSVADASAAVVGAAAAGKAGFTSDADRALFDEAVKDAPAKKRWTWVDDSASGITLMLAAGAELAEAGMDRFW